MLGRPGSCVDSQVPSKSDVDPLPEDDESDEEDDGDEGDEGDDDVGELPPLFPARSVGDVGRSDVVLFVNWQPAATADQSTTAQMDRYLIPVLTHL
jgi:hypothetical protein